MFTHSLGDQYRSGRPRRPVGDWSHLACLLAFLAASAHHCTADAVIPTETAPPRLVERVFGRTLHQTHHEAVAEVLTHTSSATAGTETVTNTLRRLQTGGFFQDDQGVWHPSKEEIELFADGAVARQGAHRVIWPMSLTDPEGVDISTADGRRIGCRLLGIGYFDPASGRSVIIAEPQPSKPELLSDNRLIYRNVFPDLAADVVFEYRKHAVAQDVVFRADAFPRPEAYGFDSALCQVEVITEFFVDRPPVKERRLVPMPDRLSRVRLEMPDDEVSFGEYSLGQGKLFWEQGEQNLANPTPLGAPLRRWEDVSGRQILFESVPFDALLEQVRQLPRQASASRQVAPSPTAPNPARRLPAVQSATPRSFGTRLASVAASQPIKASKGYAQADPKPALVWDWVLLASQANKVLEGNQTYLVESVVNLSGTTVIEGNCVVKFRNTGTARLNVIGSALTCKTDAFRPAILTAADDQTVGQAIPNTQPTPQGTYAVVALQLPTSSGGTTLSHLRISHAQTALCGPATTLTFTNTYKHLQIVNCQTGIQEDGLNYMGSYVYRTVYAGNLLMVDVGTAIAGSYLQGAFEHLTVDGCSLLTQCGGLALCPLTFKNCILASVSQLSGGAYLSNSSRNGFYGGTPQFGSSPLPLPANPFTSPPVGGGTHFLTADTLARDAATAPIDGNLSGDLQKRTTRIPSLWTGYVRVEKTLGMGGLADSLPLDLGWHYPVVDWLSDGVAATSTARLTLTNGVAVAVLSDYGITLAPGAVFRVDAAPNNLARLLRWEAIRERALAGTPAPAARRALLRVDSVGAAVPQVSLRFAEVCLLSSDPGQARLLDCGQTVGTSPCYPVVVSIAHSQIWGASLSIYPGWTGTTVSLFNSLFHRCSLYLDQKRYYGTQTFPVALYNNHLLGASFGCHYNDPAVPWTIKDNLFDTVWISQDGGYPTANSHNGYYNTTLLSGSTSHRLLTVTPLYVTSYLGTFYYPNSGGAGTLYGELVGNGSRLAKDAGLFHYTVQNNQSKEQLSQVDIGRHYLVVNGSKIPADADSDGLADYLEDSNGDGDLDPGEWDFTNAVPHSNGLGDLQEFELTFNILVNDPEQDYGNEQNTQFETTAALSGGNLVVGFVDSNHGVYALGMLETYYPGYCVLGSPRFVGYAVSHDGAMSFRDLGNPPMGSQHPNASGDGGDPILVSDATTGSVYLFGNPSRQPSGWHGLRVWRSTDQGRSFSASETAGGNLDDADRLHAAVDNFSGSGQHYVYATIGDLSTTTTKKCWLVRSTDFGATWCDAVWYHDPGYNRLTRAPTLAVLPSHEVVAFWTDATDARIMVLNLGPKAEHALSVPQQLGTPVQVCSLTYGSKVDLLRSDSAPAGDVFSVMSDPVVAVNPVSGHIYLVYADKGAGSDKMDIFFKKSTDGGVTWSGAPMRVNGDSTTRDQWMPIITVKPDGQKLFFGWYDRRNDPQNGLIDLYGLVVTNVADLDNGFANMPNFRITTASFPPVFTGTTMTDPGEYDPIYPIRGLDVTPLITTDEDDQENCVTYDTYIHHVGEYNAALSDNTHVFLVWADNRDLTQATLASRNQANIRACRFHWP